MKKLNQSILALFGGLALPIPLSILSWFGSIGSLADFGMMSGSSSGECALAISALLTMISAGTYTITYLVSLMLTLRQKRISFVSFLPIIHIGAFVFFLFSWMFLEPIYY